MASQAINGIDDLKRGASDAARQLSRAVAEIGLRMKKSGIAMAGSFGDGDLGNLAISNGLPNMGPKPVEADKGNPSGNKPPKAPIPA